MSTRWYPLYQRGNPQLRVFLPNFWMKIIRPDNKVPPNIVQFHCSMEMTKHDVKNYLEKIYNVPVVDVKTRISLGRFRKEPYKGYVIKDDDRKLAYVTLPPDMKFEFPNITESPNKKEDDGAQSLDEAKKTYVKYLNRNKNRPDVPSWFSI